MDFATLMSERWSCRAFRPEPIPAETISRMFDLAARTASWCNTQPWHAYVVSGDAIERFRGVLLAQALAHEREPDFAMPEEYLGVYQDRRRESGYALYASLGIERSDRPARAEQMLRNFSFFGAPHVAVITTPASLEVYGAIDCGGYITNLMHAAHSLGIATVPQAAIAMYPSVVREFLGAPDDRLVVAAVSFGRADERDPANGFRTSRVDSDTSVTYLSD